MEWDYDQTHFGEGVMYLDRYFIGFNKRQDNKVEYEEKGVLFVVVINNLVTVRDYSAFVVPCRSSIGHYKRVFDSLFG